MAGSKTAYLAQKMLDHALGGATFTPPATVYIALSSTAFDPSATGTSMNELTGGAYARISLANSSASWTAASAAAPSLKHNISDIVWATATADWTAPLSVYVADASTGGNLLFGADLNAGLSVLTGDTFKILAGTYIFSED